MGGSVDGSIEVSDSNKCDAVLPFILFAVSIPISIVFIQYISQFEDFQANGYALCTAPHRRSETASTAHQTAKRSVNSRSEAQRTPSL